MFDYKRLSTIKGVTYLEFRCSVLENGAQCNNRHLEPVLNKDEVVSIAESGFICSECERKGYAWYTRLLGHVDEKGEIISSIITEGLGVRNDEFRLTSNSSVQDGKLVANPTVGDKQKAKGDKGSASIKGWSLVRAYPEFGDFLMLRNEEAKNPGDPVVVRKSRTTIGLANPPKSDNPFDELFDG